MGFMFGTNHFEIEFYMSHLKNQVVAFAQQNRIKGLVTEKPVDGDTSMDDFVVRTISEVVPVECDAFESGDFQDSAMMIAKIKQILGLSDEQYTQMILDEMKNLEGSYKCGDPMHTILSASKHLVHPDELTKMMLVDRNNKWWADQDVFGKRHKSYYQRLMLIVGNAHLHVGPTGLLNRSKKAGWKVERCDIAWPESDWDASKSAGFMANAQAALKE